MVDSLLGQQLLGELFRFLITSVLLKSSSFFCKLCGFEIAAATEFSYRRQASLHPPQQILHGPTGIWTLNILNATGTL